MRSGQVGQFAKRSTTDLMAWETRKGSLFYYRKRRVAGRVVSVYAGAGLAGQIAAEEDQAQRVKAQAVRDELAESDAFDRELDHLSEAIDALTDATLLTSGFHQRKREWRKMRDD